MSSSSDLDIRRSARRLRLLVYAAMVLMVLVYVTARMELPIVGTHVEYRHELAMPLAKPIGDVAMALLIAALFRLTQMLGRIAGGELFSARVIRHFRGFALWLLLMALFELLAPVVAGVLGATDRYPHQFRMVFDLRALLTAGITFLLFLLATLLDRARGLDEEMREII